ncbi:serine protease [Paucibacter sp. R3-3]|uniref:Serine protease n=1 Tax=Roseateles agri TaxID=3098619 RepID=A0ABU5DMQ1_9BURK|nr:serine protease [Paucibacter sp. R3-3]MDY0746337.1 serine protease [Paucibacter sp. R3-3]
MRKSLARAGRIGAVFLMVGLQAGLSAFAAPLDADIQRRVREATFEVVVPKPAKETVTYDKAWQDLIPYQLRSDKYLSIGTAFAIGPGRYVTAMHVLSAAFGDSQREPMLRDAAGNIYPIDKIVKGSADQDFVMFTLAKAPGHSAVLDVQEKPELNETVYAVGNALGEGIVMREGNYTSDTPEEESGRWKWQRFSAPISGGNSGGPLVDAKGQVIGVVRAMRTSENTLNFAVPIELVTKAPENVVTVDSRSITGFLVFDATKASRVKADIPLPKSFADFSAAYAKLSDDFSAGQLRELMAENASDTFPRGKSSERLLHGLYERSAPGVVVKGGNGLWAIPSLNFTRLDLGHDGWQDAASFKGISIFHRHKPDDVQAAAWYADPQLARELVLKSSPPTIHVGGENAKILSMGKPEEDTRFTDIWGRVWQIRIWHPTTAFSSEWLAEFDLPVPDGTVGFDTRLMPIARASQLERLKLLTGFIAASYEGKLSQWDQFLKQEALLPRQLKPAMLRVDYGRSLAFDDRRLAFSFGPDLQKIERDLHLRLDFAFIPTEADAALLDIAGVSTFNSDDKTETGIFRHSTPAASANESVRKEWQKRLHHEHPYDAVASLVNGKQAISAIYGSADAEPAPEVLYTFQYRAESTTSQDAMKAKLDLLMRDAKVGER